MQPVPADLELTLADENATAALAGWLAARLEPGSRLWLSGDLGTGKTTFVRTLLATLGHTGRVRSPTFTLMEPYNLSRFPLYHFDFYRFSSTDDWRHAGFDEALGDDAAVAVVEWPEMAGGTLPAPDVQLSLRFAEADGAGCGRQAGLAAGSARGRAWLTDLTAAIAGGRLAGVSSGTA